MKQRAARQATAAMMQQAAMQEALRMEQIAAMQQAMMMQHVAMQQAAMSQRAASLGYRLGMRIYTADDTAAYVNAMQMRLMMSGIGGGGGGSAPEIDAGPAAGAVALLVAGMLMLVDRRTTRLA
jgi:hypothetical protein